MVTRSAESAAPAPVYPLKVGPNGRYLVDQRDVPFLMVGDSPQAMIGKISVDDADFFLANRHQHGINTIWINLLCNDYTGCDADGTTFDGVAPLTTSGDLATPNEVYFARAAQFIALAARYDMTVVLDPIETGGWMRVLRANGADKAYAFGRYLGQRYSAFSNIVWMSGNDFQTWRDPNDDALVLAVARGIKVTDPGQIQTVELDYFVSSSLDDSTWAPIVQLEAAYTYRPTYAEVLKDYNRASSGPVFMVEANYEWEHDFTGPQTLRRQEYWSTLSGATGQLYGNRYTWPLAPGWKTHLDTIGSAQLSYLTNLLAPRRWYDLVPDQDHSLVTDGYGNFSGTGSVNDNDYVTAARTADGRLAMVYLPSASETTIDLRTLTGPVQARWYDPANGTFSGIDGSPLAPSGPRRFHTPGTNSDGDSDWVLILETAA